MYRNTNNIYTGVVFILSVLLFLSVAVYNGFPLTTSDSGSYIRHAFDFQVPKDRSPFYGVFIAFSGLWRSLWLTVVAQSVILSYILLRYIRLLSGGRLSWVPYLICTVLIAACTCAPWIVAYIMPDVFAAIMLLATLLLIADRAASRLHTILYILILLLSILVHNSHFLIFFLFALFFFLFVFLVRQKALRKTAAAFLSLAIGCLLFMSAVNYAIGFGFTLSGGSHVFLMGRLVETGILKKYLDENCNKKDYSLCAYRDQLPTTAVTFLWDENSPLYKTGAWDSSKTEYGAIIKDILTSHHYAPMFAGTAVTGTFQQLAIISPPSYIIPQDSGSSPWLFIHRHLPQHEDAFLSSRQNTSGLHTGWFHYIYVAAFLLSSFWILIIARQFPDKKIIAGIYAIIILFIICNAFITAAFANVLDRLQVRIFWVLPATNILLIVRHYLQTKSFFYGVSRQNL